jgi:proline iminopeptidase
VPRVRANGLQLEVETLGDPADPTVLLIMGLGMQLVAWPEDFCRSLVDAGYHVVRFDNRDVGLSDKIRSERPINLPVATLRYLLRLPVAAPYLIGEMAADSIGVLDALGIRSAHLVGASLGGMIAQTAAARYPERCLSLTSIMSSSGDRRLPTASWRVSRQLLSRPGKDASLEQLTEHFARLFKAIGSPGFPVPPALLRERLAAGLKRSYHPQGTAQQLLAIIASGDRSADLESIAAPTLVIHGSADPLVPVKHGIDSARKIRGATLKLIPGMGHDLPPGALPILCEALLGHLRESRIPARP